MRPSAVHRKRVLSLVRLVASRGGQRRSLCIAQMNLGGKQENMIEGAGKSSVDPYKIGALPNLGDMRNEESMLPDDWQDIWGTENKEKLLLQIAYERRSVDMAAEKYNKLKETVVQLGMGGSLQPVQRMLLGWYTPLLEAIKLEQRDVVQKKYSYDRERYGVFLCLLPSDKLAVITMHVVLNLLLVDANGIKFTHVAKELGASVMTQANAEKLKGEKSLWNQVLNNGRASSRLVNSVSRRALQSRDWGDALKVRELLSCRNESLASSYSRLLLVAR